MNELTQLEMSYWWHVAKRELIIELLLRHAPPVARLVEAGVGPGGNLSAFRAQGYEVTGFDIMPEAVQLCRRRKLGQVFEHDVTHPWPFHQGSMDIAILLDVIEHCADATEVLGNAKRVLRPDGCLIVTVPAVPWLFGPWDTALGHQRRYTVQRLRQEAAEAGFRDAWLSYWNAFSLPAAIVTRTLQKYRRTRQSARFPRVGRLTNQLLIRCARLERIAIRHGLLPYGLSIVGVFRP